MGACADLRLGTVHNNFFGVAARLEKTHQISSSPTSFRIVALGKLVCKIKDTFPIADHIKLEGQVIAVDSKDLQRISSATVNKNLAQNSWQPDRNISML